MIKRLLGLFFLILLMFSGALASESIVFHTDNGKYFHLSKDCSGMQNAKPNSISSAISKFKKPCPVCFDTEEKREIYRLPLPKVASDSVYIAVTNYYYHRDPGCFDMFSITKLEKQIAEAMGMQACPQCLFSFIDTKEIEQTYISKESKYYHSDKSCPSFVSFDSIQCTYTRQAQAQGKLRCPVCNQTEPKDAYLFKNAFGQSLSTLMEGYIFEREDIQNNHKIWFFSNGNEIKKMASLVSKVTDVSGDSSPLYLNVEFESRENSLRFIEKVSGPIKSLYTLAFDSIKEHVPQYKLDNNLQAYDWPLCLRVYFSENQQLNGCEMEFGEYGDEISLGWTIEASGKIQQVSSEKGVLAFVD